MKLEKFIQPWTGFALRHIPDGNEVLDFSFCGLSTENRWNVPGESTLYLAASKQVAVGEYSRHYKESRVQGLIKKTQKRSFWQLELELNRTIDLCNPAVYSHFPNAPDEFKNIKTARSIASFLRNAFQLEAMFVPSMVFLDDLSKWCLVIFLENLYPDLGRFILNAEKIGFFEIGCT